MSKFLRGKVNQAWPHSAKPPVASASIRVLSPTFISNEDPTKTITLRAKYVTDVNNRFNAIKTVIRQSVVDNDCFGLVDKPQNIEEIMALGYREELAKLNVIPKEGFRFLRDPEKVSEFMRWLDTQQDKGVLEIVHRSGVHQKGISSWQNTYIQSSYQKGLSRARADLVKSGVDIPSWEEMPGGVSGAFYQAMHADAVGLIYTRAYNELKGVTAAMDQQISRVLANGLVEGVGPYEMARRINDRVDKIGINRARTIARTETIQTFNTAVINEFASASNLIGEKVFCQWWTARDDRVRLHHSNRHGRVFSQERAQELIGEPNCRCTLVPYIKSLHQKGGVLRPAKGGTLPPSGSTPIIKPPPAPTIPLGIDNILATDIFPPTTASAGRIDSRVIRDNVAQDLSDQLGDKYKVSAEAVDMGGGDELQQLVIQTKKGKYVGNVRYDIDLNTGHIFYDDVNVDKIFQKKGIASTAMNLLDYTSSSISKKLGQNALASLDAQEAGRYVWARLGYNITDPRDLAKIKEFAKSKGIIIRKRDDLSKLKKWFNAEDNGLPHSFGMDKGLEAPEVYRARMVVKAPKDIKPPKSPAAVRAGLEQQRTKLVKKRAEVDSFSGGFDLDDKISDVDIKIARTYVDEASITEYNRMKFDSFRRMLDVDQGVQMTKAMERKIRQGIEWIPYDVLEKLRAAGYRGTIRNEPKSKFRAFFRDQEKGFHVAKDDTYDVISHELSHAVDHFFSDQRMVGGRWRSGAFVKYDDSVDFNHWFNKHKAKGGDSRGVYSNGDGEFWKDNWMNDYEGRIYHGAGNGTEWWAMNIQRYSRYRVKLSEAPKVFRDTKSDLKDLLKRRADNVGLGNDVPAWMDRKIKSLESKLELSHEEWAEGVSRWGMAKRRYPDLTKFIENKFSGYFVT